MNETMPINFCCLFPNLHCTCTLHVYCMCIMISFLKSLLSYHPSMHTLYPVNESHDRLDSVTNNWILSNHKMNRISKHYHINYIAPDITFHFSSSVNSISTSLYLMLHILCCVINFATSLTKTLTGSNPPACAKWSVYAHCSSPAKL